MLIENGKSEKIAMKKNKIIEPFERLNIFSYGWKWIAVGVFQLRMCEHIYS